MEYNFVYVLAEEFTCQVCMKLLDEPQLTDCCGQHFCQACLGKWFKQKGKKQCPHCRSETFTHILNKPLKRKINELMVYCSNRTKGCGLTMKLEELEGHLSRDISNGCGYITVKCPNMGCIMSCLRKDLTDHTKNRCLLRNVKCIYCGAIGKYNYITSTSRGFFSGHLSGCQGYPVDCPRSCDTVRDLKRKDLEAHKEVCPLEPVECPFRKVGCKQEQVRKDLDHHIQSSTQQHLLILMASHKTLLREHKEVCSTVAGVASELETLQTTVTDRSVASSLERITTTLNQVSLRLDKEGDQLTFRISGGREEWISPIFTVDDKRMYLHLHVNENLQQELQYTFSLYQLTGECIGQPGKHEIKVEYQFDQPKIEATPVPKLIQSQLHTTTTCTMQLCANCTHLVMRALQVLYIVPRYHVQTAPRGGKHIAQLHTRFYYRIRDVTLTLEKHKCPMKTPTRTTNIALQSGNVT